jgi:hypothetical protein
MNTEINEQFDHMVESGLCTEAEIQLVTCINGYNQQTLDDIVYARTGYMTWQQLSNEERRWQA